MNRWIWPGGVAVVVAGATVAATLVGAQPVPETPFTASETRVSVVCPGFESPTATVEVAAASISPGLQTSTVTEPAAVSAADGFTVLKAPGAARRVSALLPGPFGATTSVSAADGADRGLSASGCATPSTDHWFTGVDIREVAQSEVVVANLDGTRASVDLTVYGADGKISAPRGVEVEPNSVETISLGTLDRVDGPVTVEVSSGDGRVAAFVRQRTWAGEEPLGADWLAETTAPATDVVVPGVPEGSGGRTLVVTNPGERTATVSIGTFMTSGPGEVAGASELEVPAGTTRTIDLAADLDGLSAALHLTSTQPVSAGVWLDTGDADARHDPAYTVGTTALPSDSLWPLALGSDAKTLLQLVNPGDAEATVTVTLGDSSRTGDPEEVTVPAGSLVEVALDKGATNLVRIRTEATTLRGALVSTATLGKVRGLAVVPLVAEDGRGEPATVVFDPHAGS
ncbi:MAG: DUF5719 family protein [Propionicimonas sp.]|uniref:DUF5719 family protein n=1 Tax=Propionicimonas sp. TaxID=1955623 RepID=UPI003D107981